MVASIIMYSLSGSLAKCLKMRSKTPLFAHRLKRWWTIFQSPKRSGRSRQGMPGSIPVKNRFDEQPIVRRRSADMPLPAGQKILDPLPLVVPQCVAPHRSALLKPTAYESLNN